MAHDRKPAYISYLNRQKFSPYCKLFPHHAIDLESEDLDEVLNKTADHDAVLAESGFCISSLADRPAFSTIPIDRMQNDIEVLQKELGKRMRLYAIIEAASLLQKKSKIRLIILA